MVNVIAPIMADEKGAWRQTTFYPFSLFAKYCGDYLLNVKEDYLVTQREDCNNHFSVLGVNLDSEKKLIPISEMTEKKASIATLSNVEIISGTSLSLMTVNRIDEDYVKIKHECVNEVNEIIINPHSFYVILIEQFEC